MHTLELIAHAMRTGDEAAWRELRRLADAGDDIAYVAICADPPELVGFMRAHGFNFHAPGDEQPKALLIVDAIYGPTGQTALKYLAHNINCAYSNDICRSN